MTGARRYPAWSLDARRRQAKGSESGGKTGMMAALLPALALLVPFSSVSDLAAQQRPERFQRRLEATQAPTTIFHSTTVINLPTAETIGKGELLFEIGHRFFPAVSEGADALWGLDGPVNMRIGLGYAPTDRLLVTLARSNLLDNYDLQIKLRALELGSENVPLLVALQGGVAWSTEVPERDATDKGNFQYYGQLIVNALLAERLALGVVPSYLYNTLLDRIDPVQDLFWGFYGQLYLSDVVSLMGEWSMGDGQGETQYDTGAFGVELETGGHFFKLFLTNSFRLNPSQFLVGSVAKFEPDEWKLGFSITRILRF